MEDLELPKNAGEAVSAEWRSKGTLAHLSLPSPPLPDASPAPSRVLGPGLAAQPSAQPSPPPYSLALRRDKLPNRHFRIGLEYELSFQTLQNASCSPFRSKVSSKLLFYASKISHFPRRQCHRLTEPKHMLEKTSCDLLLQDEGIRAVYKVMILLGWWRLGPGSVSLIVIHTRTWTFHVG